MTRLLRHGEASFALLALALTATACGDAERTSPSATAAAAPSLVCEHDLPRDVCPRCNPSLEAVYRARGDWCDEHGMPESFCPHCHPEAAARLRAEAGRADPPEGSEAQALRPSQIETRFVFLREGELEDAAGIATEPATAPLPVGAIECPVRIVFDADRLADVRALVPGVVRRVHVDLGDRVEAGQALFELAGTQVSDAQGTLARARERLRVAEANLARQRALREDGINAVRDVELAERERASASAEARSAHAFLRVAGAGTGAPNGRAVVRAPLAGEVVRRPAVLGTLASPESSLATIVDTSRLWALCDVRETDGAALRVGASAEVTVGDQQVRGEVTWIAPELDERTRTITARIEVANSDGTLRAQQYGRARVQAADAELADGRDGVSVPREALQRVGDHEVVFVRVSEGEYHPRVVTREPSRSAEDARVHVRGRLAVGDAVVTTGAILLRTEILPGSIGAGCCEVPGAEGER